jgi:hypothetical protein
MKRIALLGLLVSATWACTSHEGPTNDAALAQCSAGQTVLYSKVTPPSAGVNGASGIADAPAVLGGGAASGSSAPTGDPASSGAASTAAYASTAASCVPAVCPAGQVAVPKEHPTGNASGGTAGAVSPPAGAAGGSDSATAGTPSSGVSTPTPTPTTDPGATPPTTVTASEVICTAPPPACEAGEAPSFAPAGFWHCMPVCDANNAELVVISYGGIYGNGGICAGPPPQSACPTAGQVWTWNFLDEAWECEVECNNGQYDQHTFGNQTVCVPC